MCIYISYPIYIYVVVTYIYVTHTFNIVMFRFWFVSSKYSECITFFNFQFMLQSINRDPFIP